MPTYAYRCTECGHAFDIVQAFTDDSLTVCPSCGGSLRKVFNSIGVTFNGSGFYRTDSREGASKSASSSSSSDSSSSSSSAPAAAPAAAPSTPASTASTPSGS